MPLRVAIIENEQIFADALQTTLNARPEQFDCREVFYNCEKALAHFKINAPSPEIILLDLDLGEGRMNGIESISHLKQLNPSVLIMVLTVYEDHQKVFDALAAGALGDILKSATPEKIMQAIVELSEGGSPMSPSIARKIAVSFSSETVWAKNTVVADALSAREREVIELIARGKLEKEVAAELFISLKTVKTHITNIYQKLQVHTRVEALNKYFGR